MFSRDLYYRLNNSRHPFQKAERSGREKRKNQSVQNFFLKKRVISPMLATQSVLTKRRLILMDMNTQIGIE